MKPPALLPDGAAETLRRLDQAMRRVPAESVFPADSSGGGRYKELITNAPIGVYRVSRSGQLLLSNPALVRMLGRASLEDFLSENGKGPFSSQARSRFWLRLEKEREIKGYESEWLRSDGTRVFLREHARAVRGPDQETACYEGTLEDISDRRAAEKQIQAERDFSSAVIDAAGTLVIILDCEGRIIRFNQACELLSGYSLHEVAGQSPWDIFSPHEETDGVRQCYQKVAAGEFPAKHECSWRVKTGELRHIAWSDSALLDGQGGIRNMISMGIDITDRKAAEDALRLSESRYRELFESASDVIFRMSLDGRILEINGAAERLTGYKRNELHHQAQLLEPEYLAMTRARLQEKLDGSPDAHFEIPVRTVDGENVYLDLKANISYENGVPIEILGIGRDITWRKQAEELERSRRSILEMAARHEPLPAVMLKLTRLLEAQFPKSRCSVEIIPIWQSDARAVQGLKLPVYQLLSPADPEFDLGFRMHWQLPVLSSENAQLAVISLLTERSDPPTAQESDILANKVKLAALTIEHRVMTDSIQWDAEHDKLTDLANRGLFEQRLQQAISRSEDGRRPLAIFYLDLDRFKLINDTLGHEIGDCLLKAVAEKIVSLGRATRPGGAHGRRRIHCFDRFGAEP